MASLDPPYALVSTWLLQDLSADQVVAVGQELQIVAVRVVANRLEGADQSPVEAVNLEPVAMPSYQRTFPFGSTLMSQLGARIHQIGTPWLSKIIP